MLSDLLFYFRFPAAVVFSLITSTLCFVFSSCFGFDVLLLFTSSPDRSTRHPVLHYPPPASSTTDLSWSPHYKSPFFCLFNPSSCFEHEACLISPLSSFWWKIADLKYELFPSLQLLPNLLSISNIFCLNCQSCLKLFLIISTNQSKKFPLSALLINIYSPNISLCQKSTVALFTLSSCWLLLK